MVKPKYTKPTLTSVGLPIKRAQGFETEGYCGTGGLAGKDHSGYCSSGLNPTGNVDDCSSGGLGTSNYPDGCSNGNTAYGSGACDTGNSVE